MPKSNKKALFCEDCDTLWNIITSLEEYGWRSGVSRIEVLEPGKRFVEYTEGGFATTFTITAFVPPRRYEFDMESETISGHWTGLLTAVEGGKTELDFTEDVTVKKQMMKPFAKLYLKMQQKKYMRDLAAALKK